MSEQTWEIIRVEKIADSYRIHWKNAQGTGYLDTWSDEPTELEYALATAHADLRRQLEEAQQTNREYLRNPDAVWAGLVQAGDIHEARIKELNARAEAAEAALKEAHDRIDEVEAQVVDLCVKEGAAREELADLTTAKAISDSLGALHDDVDTIATIARLGEERKAAREQADALAEACVGRANTGRMKLLQCLLCRGMWEEGFEPHHNGDCPLARYREARC